MKYLDLSGLSHYESTIKDRLNDLPEEYDIPVADGFVAVSDSTQRSGYTRTNNGLVIVSFKLWYRTDESNYIPNGTGILIGTIPAGYRPSKIIHGTMYCEKTPDSESFCALVYINTDGTIRIDQCIDGVIGIMGSIAYHASQ